MKKIGILALFLLITAPTFAALAPLNQSIREYTAILQSPELQKNLPVSEEIQDIWNLNGRYIVTTQNMQIVVEVIYQPSSQPGPRPFTLRFYKAKPITE